MALEEDTAGQAAPEPGREALRRGEAHGLGGAGATGQAPGKSPPPREKHRIYIDFQTTSRGALRPVITGDPNLHLRVHASTHTRTHAQAHVRLSFSQFSQT